MEAMENNFVWVAFNREYNRQMDVMAEIIKRFTGRYPTRGQGGHREEYQPAYDR